MSWKFSKCLHHRTKTVPPRHSLRPEPQWSLVGKCFCCWSCGRASVHSCESPSTSGRSFCRPFGIESWSSFRDWFPMPTSTNRLSRCFRFSDCSLCNCCVDGSMNRCPPGIILIEVVCFKSIHSPYPRAASWQRGQRSNLIELYHQR